MANEENYTMVLLHNDNQVEQGKTDKVHFLCEIERIEKE
jgi:hypothetical protein